MKDTKTEFRFFTVPEWEKEQDYLRQKHKEGWKFVKVNLLGLYHFERCTPEDVIYQLDYNPDGIAHKDEYVQMFNDCGWEYLQDFVGYSYFRKSASQMDGEEEIFCDNTSRLDMMKRIFKGRMLPLLCIFLLIILPQLHMQNHAGSPVMLGAFAALGVLYIFLFAWFGFHFWKYWNSLRK